MTKKAEMGKQELNKYKDRMYLSPASQKKKSQLEKWVEKQEHKIQQKRAFMNENMNDLISKMQQDIDITKRKINMGNTQLGLGANSARKDSNTSLRFNVSHDISQICDMSLGHISQSVNATPRIIGGINMGMGVINPSQQQVSNNNSNNRSQSLEQQKQQQQPFSQQQPNRKLFDYKLAQQSHSRDRATSQQQIAALSSQQSEISKLEEAKNLLQIDKDHQRQRSRVSNSIDQNLSSVINSSKRSFKTDKNTSSQQQQQQQIIDNNDIKLELKTEEDQLKRRKTLSNKSSNQNIIFGDCEDDSDLNDRSNIFKSEIQVQNQQPAATTNNIVDRQHLDLGSTSKSMINNNEQSQTLNPTVTNVFANSQNNNQLRQGLNNKDTSEIITSSNAADDPYPVDEEDNKPAPFDVLVDDDLENESLSKMEPPNFQSPSSIISAMTPSRNYIEDDEDNENNAPPSLPQQQKPFQINKQDVINSSSSNNDSDADDILISGGKINQQNGKSLNANLDKLNSNKIDQVAFSGPDSEREYSNAFLSLKEPEHPITIDKLQKLKEEKQEREEQTEMLTEYILALLMEQMKYNMFPKRPVIIHNNSSSSTMRSPSKDDMQNASSYLLDTQSVHSNDDDLKSEEKMPAEQKSLISSSQSEKEQNQDELSQLPSMTNSQNVEPSQSPSEELQPMPPKKKKIRGIRTSMRVVDQYIAQVFKKVKDSEDEFVENLSTPLNKDPLEILLHLQNAVFEGEMENAVAYQQSVLPVDLYLDLERNKTDVQVAENSEDEDALMNKSMMGEWENIHNKVIFDGINEALDNYRPYGLRGPPMPWSQQTRTLTYKNGQQIDSVLRQVRLKVMEWSRTFSGALPCSELLQEYGIKGPLDEDKLNLLREERLALVLAAEIEENEMLWTDYEYEETQTKLDVADMILEFLAEEVAQDLNKIKQNRQNITTSTTADNTTIARDNNNE